MRFYGEGIPGIDPAELAGKLIVIEGADGSGRSTLVSEELLAAKQGNVLGEITRSLFYATDFADQLENRIIPALRAGFIVLADRFIYTLMARDIVRGADREWVRSLYGIALIPDLVVYLKVSPAQLVERNLRKNSTLDYWESGMDLGLTSDSFDSFIRYQRLIQKEFMVLQQQYGFITVNGNFSMRAVAREISAKVTELLGV